MNKDKIIDGINKMFIQNLCSRLPYDLKGKVTVQCPTGKYDYNGELLYEDVDVDVILTSINVKTEEIKFSPIDISSIKFIDDLTIHDFTPYLRSLSKMTEDEVKEYKHLVAFSGNPEGAANFIEWLNKHQFDYLYFIENNLALESSN